MVRRGLSLVEIIIASVILSAGIIPMYSMMSNTNRQFDRQSKFAQAHYLARSVLERLIAIAPNGLQQIPAHNEFLSIVPQPGTPLSPWFSTASAFPLNEDVSPVLSQDLSTFRISVQLLPIKGAEQQKARMARVEILYDVMGGKEKSRVVLQTLVSEYVSI